MKFRRLMILTVSILMLVFLPPAVFGQFMFDENPLVGKQAPDFKLRTVSGETVSFNQYRGNGPAMIVFWATWCPSCRGELKTLNSLQDVLAKSGTKVILVNLEENPRQVAAYAAKLKIPYKIFLDEKSEIAEKYGVIGLPTVFFVNGQGVVVSMEFGLPADFVEIMTDQASKKG